MQKTLTRYENIDKLYRIGLNVPEMLINLPRPADPLEYQKYHVILDQVYKDIRNKGLRTVIMSNTANTIEYIEPSRLKEELDNVDYGKEGILILKAPKSETIHTGFIIPGPHYFVAKVDEIVKKFVWGMHRTFTIKHQKVLQSLNDMITNRRLDLDGSMVEFTFHPTGEGVLSDNLLFWGFKEQKYIEGE